MEEPTLILDKSIAEQPILLPEHPYVVAIKNFGLDELIAGIIDAFTTTAVNAFLDPNLKTSILPFVGPVMEKIGFFPAHIKKAMDVYKTTRVNRKSKSFYIKKALKDGSGNLIKDICFHDPLYIGFMSAGLHKTSIPPGALSALSYITGVLFVAGIDVGKDELRYANTKKALKKSGFGLESYFESRFHILAEKDPEEVREMFAKEFGLEDAGSVAYHDKYFANRIPSFSGRTAKVRIRSRQPRADERLILGLPQEQELMSSAQIIFSRAREERQNNRQKPDQCRYYPIRKEKLYFPISAGISNVDGITNIDSVLDSPAKDILLKSIDNSAYTNKIVFNRHIIRNDNLAVCTDMVNLHRPAYVVELKVFNDTKLLKEAMRYLMTKCPVAAIQTTHGKSDMFCTA